MSVKYLLGLSMCGFHFSFVLFFFLAKYMDFLQKCGNCDVVSFVGTGKKIM